MPRQTSGASTPIQELVRRQRHELALSMSDIADKADITRSHLYSLLDGSTRDPSVHTLTRLSGALQVSPIVLLRHYLHGHQASLRGQAAAGVVRSQTTPGDAVAVIPHLPTHEHPTLIAPGETFTQTWSLHNVGTVAWQARRLVRLDDELVIARRTGEGLEAVEDAHLRCSAACTAVPDTAPGQSVALHLDFTAPARNGTFTTLWHLCDEHGRASFPRDFFLQAVVTVVGF
ncbi:NBR1-Ig-like domain-containing protein [Sphaerotilus sp.]|uniref:NBR1-Ig-like domain-containing protein n=1 Tax=Sphaerotilus sp. TaxID=2093942 RepID=UPI002ACD7B1A|nr:NBR1-Ig-like domain-containing protein [Sphaerotilus sp.]MDZ7855286.1 NBR1-Ig-like domain-containing protein [Sphaerotilus sp.]